MFFFFFFQEKRQTQIQIPIQFISDGPGLETSLFYEGERLVQLNGEGAMRMDLALNATFVCDVDGTDISMCSSITGPLVPPSAPEANITKNGTVTYTGPGCLYSDPNNILIIDIDQICDIIESNRPNFPTIIPPVEIMVTSRAMPERLVLNIDDTNVPDNVADTEDDIIDLTGSTSRTFTSSDFSLTYRDNVVTVRRGPSIVDTIEGIGEFSALLQVSSPRGTRLRFTRASGSSNSFFSGPGQLVTGTNTRTGTNAAFFTDSSEVSRNINRDIVNSQLMCNIINGVPIIQRVSDDQVLTSLSGVESLTFPDATLKTKGTNMLIINGMFGAIRTFICDDGISLACFVNNQARFFPATMTGINISVDSGGLSVLYDEESCNVFAYPTTNTLISTLIQNCTSRATVTPAPPIRFGVEHDAFGTSVFTADGAPILQPSSSRSVLVGGNEVIDYSRDIGRLTIRGREGDRAIYNGIRQFTVNRASNRLKISGSRNIINGPGNLFVDDTGQSFFTTSDSLASFIQSSATGPSRQVSVVGTVDNGATSVNLQIGNRNIFNLGPDTTERPIQDDESLIYSGNMLFTSNAMRIPSDNRVNYFGMNLVQIVRESTGEVIRERSTPRLFSPNIRGDVPVIQSNNISLPGGGVFYRGTGGDVYLPDDSIYPSAITVLDTVGATTTITDDMGNPEDVTSLGFYNSDGSVYQVFNGSSPRTLFGPGSIYTSGGSYFYTNNRGLRPDIRSGNSRLRPPLIAFNVRFSTNAGEFITNFPGNSELIDVQRGTVVYSGGNINFVFRTDIDSLTYFDGLQVQMFNASTQTEPAIFPGPGSLLIDGRRAIYSSDSLISSRIHGVLNEARCFFLPPNIPSSFPSSFISKLSQVEVGFGQEVTVNKGANVDLRCTAGNANPPATFDFFIRNDSGPLMMLEQSGNVMFIDNGVNDVTLRLLDISTDQNDVTYTCRASNSFGTTSKSTRLKVQPSGK